MINYHLILNSINNLILNIMVKYNSYKKSFYNLRFIIGHLSQTNSPSHVMKRFNTTYGIVKYWKKQYKLKNITKYKTPQWGGDHRSN